MSYESSGDEDHGGPRGATPELIIDKAKECHSDKNSQGSSQISNELKQEFPNKACGILKTRTTRAEHDYTPHVDAGGSAGVGHGSEQQAPSSPRETVQPEKVEPSEKGKGASREESPGKAPPSLIESRGAEVGDALDEASNMHVSSVTTNEAEKFLVSEIIVIPLEESSPSVSNDPVQMGNEADMDEAIEQRDWATLLSIFSKQPDFDPYAVSVWRIAIEYGCFPLVKEFLDNLIYYSQSYIKKWALDQITTSFDRRTKLTALQTADGIIGNRSISEYIKLTVGFLESSEGTISEFFANRSEGLFEAYPLTKWYRTLRLYVYYQGSRDEVQQSLKENSRLLLETFHGLSALHWAVFFDDMELLGTIATLFHPEEGIVWGDSYYPRDLTMEKLWYAKGHDGVEFNQDQVDLIRNKLGKFKETEIPRYKVSAKEIRGFVVRSMILSKELLNGMGSGKGTLQEQSPRFSAVKDHIDEEWNVNWEDGFAADVEFNFEVEPRRSLLRVHHACKDPLRFQEFLKSTSEHEHFKDFSTRMHDAQGRTLHHILLDHHTTDKLPGWAFTEIFPPEVSKFCIQHAQDSKGRKLIDVLFGKNYIHRNIILKPSFYHNMECEQDMAIRFRMNGGNSTILGNYFIACALQQTNIASQPTWVEALEAYLDMSPSKLGTLKILLFATATSTNTAMLQALSRIEPQVDFMVQDKKGRTLLHYAANPTLLKLKTLFKMGSEFERSLILDCFSTVQDYCQFRNKQDGKSHMQVNTKGLKPLVDEDKEEIKQSNARRRASILMLLQAGLDLSQQDNHGKVPNLGPTSDVDYQTWWYDLVVKDTIDNKQSFNQAGNALSVVGTLVAATSYIGPLQPPMSYDVGLVRHSEKLVEVFMVTNTLAFFLAMASVMFAVVPSLPMPRESIMSELKRARKMVLFSLCLLLLAIATIIISFSAASVVVRQYEHSFPRSNILLGPLLTGWCICFIAIASFFIRILRLSFYENAFVRTMYQFSIRKFCTRIWRLCFCRQLDN